MRWFFFFLFPTRNCLWKRSGSHYAQRSEYCRRAGLIAQNFNIALKMNRITKFQITTAACLLAILCYGLPFHDNALGGLVKPTITVMAKSQKGGSQPPKKQTNVGGSLGTIHTGSAKTHPGVLKAQADKKRADDAAAAYAKKAAAEKAAALAKAKKKP